MSCGSSLSVDDFESSPVPRKKAKSQPGSDGADTPTDRAARGREIESDTKKTRPSRDERRFSRDVERALRKSEDPASTGCSDGHTPPSLPPRGDTTAENGIIANMYMCVDILYGTAAINLFQTAAKDGEYKPEDGEGEEEGEEFVSGPGESDDDDDFSVSSLPRKKTKPAAKTTTKTKRPSKTEMSERPGGRGHGASGKPARTKQGCVSKPASQSSQTKSSTNSTCTVKSPISPLPGTPGLGMRRMAKWTPPGE